MRQRAAGGIVLHETTLTQAKEDEMPTTARRDEVNATASDVHLAFELGVEDFGGATPLSGVRGDTQGSVPEDRLRDRARSQPGHIGCWYGWLVGKPGRGPQGLLCPECPETMEDLTTAASWEVNRPGIVGGSNF